MAEAVELYAPHEDLWVRLLRGGLRRITVPALLLGSAAALAALLIARRTASAVAAVVVMLGANLTVQAVRRGVLPFVPGLPSPQLNGRVAVAVGAAFVVVLAVAPLLVSVAWIVVVLALFGLRIVAENRPGTGLDVGAPSGVAPAPPPPSAGREDA